MRCVVQRVKSAEVWIQNQLYSQIGKGYLAFVGVEENDSEQDAEYIANKLMRLRVISDDKDQMNLSITQTKGEILLVSQFTLLGDARHGNRPSFSKAMEPSQAALLIESVAAKIRGAGIAMQEGRFGADMEVRLKNDGPVTILLDSHRLF